MPGPLFAADPAALTTARTGPAGDPAGGAPAGAPGPAARPKSDPAAVLVPAGLLAVALLIAAVVLVVADRWRKAAGRGGDDGASLTDFRGMVERGEMTEAEYRVVRERMAARMKAKLGPKPPGPAAGGGGGPAGPAPGDPP